MQRAAAAAAEREGGGCPDLAAGAFGRVAWTPWSFGGGGLRGVPSGPTARSSAGWLVSLSRFKRAAAARLTDGQVRRGPPKGFQDLMHAALPRWLRPEVDGEVVCPMTPLDPGRR